MRFPTREVLGCILEREPRGWLALPELTAEEAWVLTEFLDEVQEAIWMDYGTEISDYLDAKGNLDCYHTPEDATGEPEQVNVPEDLDF